MKTFFKLSILMFILGACATGRPVPKCKYWLGKTKERGRECMEYY